MSSNYRIAPVHAQQLMLGSQLPDIPKLRISSNALARNVYGKIAEDVVCAALSLDPILINGKYDICFDATKDNIFYEIKSVHQKSKVVLYDFRMEKERDSKLPVTYAILCHQIRGARSVTEVLNGYRANGLILLTAAASIIHGFAFACELNHLYKKAVTNKRTGYTRKGYNNGYRNLPAQFLVERSTFVTQLICHPYHNQPLTIEHRTLI